MDSSKIPSHLILADVSAKNDNDTNVMMIRGKLLLFGISEEFDDQSTCFKLRIEGKQKESVHRVFASGIEKSFHILLHGRHSIGKTHEAILVEKEYEIPYTRTEGGNEISFSVSLGKESLSWKPTTKRRVQRHGPYYREADFEICYTAKVFITSKTCNDCAASGNLYYWSNAVRLHFAPVGVDKTSHDDKLRINVGAPAMIPQTRFCGLLEGPAIQCLSLVPSKNKIQLTPNQQLTIHLAYEKKATIQDGGIDLQTVHVKFSQRTICLGASFDRHWERKLAPRKDPHDEGTVEVPGWWIPSYNGEIVQICNEMTIYISKDGRKSKDMIAATPKILVQVVR